PRARTGGPRAGNAGRDGLLRAALDDRPNDAARLRAARTGERHRLRRRAEPADRRPLRPARRDRLEAAAPGRERHLGHPQRARGRRDPRRHRRLRRGLVLAVGWRGRLVRLSANYVVNEWSGTSITVMDLVSQGKLEQEFLLRFAASL